MGVRQKVFVSAHAIERFLQIYPNVPRKSAHPIIRGMYRDGFVYGAQLGNDFSLLTRKKRSSSSTVFICTKKSNGDVVIKTVMPKDMAKNNILARDLKLFRKK